VAICSVRSKQFDWELFKKAPAKQPTAAVSNELRRVVLILLFCCFVACAAIPLWLCNRKISTGWTEKTAVYNATQAAQATSR
jgi:hypothetical protein